MNPIESSPPGRYEIVTPLGEGGMARVYLAMVRAGIGGFNHLVVVKQIRPELACDSEFLGMFLNEASIAVRLHHPNVVRTYEVVEENGKHFLAMEYLDGQTLGEVLKRIGRTTMPLEEHLWLLTQVLAGLDYAHGLCDANGMQAGIIHRDVSPSNVFITYDGEVKIVDFGIAKAASEASNTERGTVKGKLGYGAPEQFLSQAVDARTDIFSVGVMLWEALAGRRRKTAETRTAILEARVTGLEAKIRDVRPDVPPLLANICDRATALLPEKRFSTAAEMRFELERYLRGSNRPVGARTLASLMTSNFANERASVQQRIDQWLGGWGSENTPHPVPTPAIIPQMPAGPASHSQLYSVSLKTPLPEGPVLTLPPRRWWPAVLGSAAALAVATIGWHFSTGSSRSSFQVAVETPVAEPTDRKPTPPPVRAVDLERAEAHPTAVPKPTALPLTVEFSVEGQPTHATVRLDDVPLSTNPFVGSVPRDDKPHRIEVSALGYETAVRTVTFAKNVRLVLSLHRVGEARRTASESGATGSGRAAGSFDRGLSTGAGRAARRELDEQDPYR